ncbi:MAG TPA: hypothetical protein VGE26_03445 [Sphingobacteriaceae bacterium]
MRKLMVILLFIFCKVIPLYGQPSGTDTAFHQSAVNTAISFYTGSQGEHVRLYTGSEYTGYRYPLLKDHPFFKTDSATKGSVFYDGMVYNDVSMWYDVVSDLIIVLNKFGNVKIVLESSRVKYFSLSDHHFVRVDSVSSIPAGFYDQLYSGTTTLLVRRSKSATQVIDEMTAKTAVQWNNDQYYVLKDGSVHRFRKPSAIKKILHDKHRGIQQFMKTNKLSFRRSREGSMVKILAYYDNVTRK